MLTSSEHFVTVGDDTRVGWALVFGGQRQDCICRRRFLSFIGKSFCREEATSKNQPLTKKQAAGENKMREPIEQPGRRTIS